MINNNEKLISLKEASRMTPYGADYMGLLIRKGRLEGFKVGGKWMTTEIAVRNYMQRAAESSYEYQQTLNVKIPAAEIKKAKANFRWGLAFALLVLIFGAVIWKMLDDKKNENIRVKYRLVEDAQGNLMIFADNPDQVKSVKVLKKE